MADIYIAKLIELVEAKLVKLVSEYLLRIKWSLKKVDDLKFDYTSADGYFHRVSNTTAQH